MDKSKQLDDKGNASYYDTERINSMVVLERTFGTYESMIFCEMTAMKYRLRMGKKNDQPIEQELLKIKWYESAAKFFKMKLDTQDGILSMGPKNKPLQWKESND